MITDCFGFRQWDLSGTEEFFVQGVFVLVKMLIPIAIGVYTSLVEIDDLWVRAFIVHARESC